MQAFAPQVGTAAQEQVLTAVLVEIPDLDRLGVMAPSLERQRTSSRVPASRPHEHAVGADAEISPVAPQRLACSSPRGESRS